MRRGKVRAECKHAVGSCVWTSKDPLRLKGGQTNLYVYVDCNPTNLVDPSGLDHTPDSQECLGCAVAAGKGEVACWEKYPPQKDGGNPDNVKNRNACRDQVNETQRQCEMDHCEHQFDPKERICSDPAGGGK